jgi:Rv0078B-related antitoxin
MDYVKIKRDPDVIARMEMLFDLYETSAAIMRQNLRRRYPQADHAEIERRLQAWLLERPDEQWKGRGKKRKPTSGYEL